MFKLVVLSALVAVASAGVLHGAAPLAYSAAYAVPSAVSHQSRTDIISKPVVAAAYHAAPAVAYAAPAVAYSAPAVAYSAPVAHYSAAIPSAVSHQSRTDIISKPVVAAYAAPAVAAYAAPAYTTYAAAPVAYKYAAAPVAYSTGYGYANKLAYY